jgi:hypothetical protein
MPSAGRRPVTRPHIFPNISLTGHRTPIFSSNAIELTRRYCLKSALMEAKEGLLFPALWS